MTAFPTVSKYFSFFLQTNFHMLQDSKQDSIRHVLHPSSHPPKCGRAPFAQVELSLHTPSTSKSAGSGRMVEQPPTATCSARGPRALPEQCQGTSSGWESSGSMDQPAGALLVTFAGKDKAWCCFFILAGFFYYFLSHPHGKLLAHFTFMGFVSFKYTALVF